MHLSSILTHKLKASLTLVGAWDGSGWPWHGGGRKLARGGLESVGFRVRVSRVLCAPLYVSILSISNPMV